VQRTEQTDKSDVSLSFIKNVVVDTLTMYVLCVCTPLYLLAWWFAEIARGI